MDKTDTIYATLILVLMSLLFISPIVVSWFIFIKEYKEDTKPMYIYTPTFEEYQEGLNKEAYERGYADGLKQNKIITK